MRLDLGSGRYPIDDAIHLEAISAYNGVDLLGVSPNLPFRSGSFESIVASHIIEHIDWWDINKHLYDWKRILKTGGTLWVQCPDFLQICERYRLDDLRYTSLNPDRVRGIWLNQRIFWWDENRSDNTTEHKAIYDFRYLEYCLKKVGFDNIEKLDISESKTFDHHCDMLVRAKK